MKLSKIILCVLLFSDCTPKTAKDRFNLGIESYNRKEYSTALAELQDCIEKDSRNSDAFYYKGLCEVQLKRDSMALVSFQNAILWNSSNYQALVERAKLKNALGDYSSSINDCDKARMFKADYAELYKTKATAYEFMDDASNAIMAYESAIKYGMEDKGETYFKLAKLLLSIGKHDEACTLLSKAGESGYMKAFELIKINCNQPASQPGISKKLSMISEKDSLYIKAQTQEEQSVNEYSSGQVTKFSSNGEGKSMGLKFHFKYPKSWQSIQGEHPHVVRKFAQSDNYVLSVIIVTKQEKEISQSDIDETLSVNGLKSMLSSTASYISSNTNLKIEGQRAASIEFTSIDSRMGRENYSHNLYYLVIYKQYLLFVQFMVFNKLGEANMIVDERYQKVKPLFYQMFNSIVIDNIWGVYP